MNNLLISYLFKTNAVKICPENNPFWYTSGKIGPYFVNTHFMYGSEQDANNLLTLIDSGMENKEELPRKIFEEVTKQYENNEIYMNVIDKMVESLKESIDLDNISYISGGERRDWFFSIILAKKLNKPHITIFKDLSSIFSTFDFSKNIPQENLNNMNVLHVTDLITVASSFVRAWIPAIKGLGGNMPYSIAVVDRMQGGKEILSEYGVNTLTVLKIDMELFDNALQSGIITKPQYDMLEDFYLDPDGSMREFLINHPEFLENSLSADSKTAGRAKLCLDNNIYELDK